MIVSCEECGKVYRIDADRIRGDAARFSCKACGNPISVVKRNRRKTATPDPAQADTVAEALPAASDRKEKAAGGYRLRQSVRSMLPARKSRFGLTEKTISLMLVVTLVPLFLFWGITFQNTNRRILGDTERLLRNSTQRLVEDIRQWRTETERSIQAFAALPAVRTLSSAEIEPVMRTVQQAYPEVESWMVLDRDRKLASGEPSDRLKAFAAGGGPEAVLATGAPVWKAWFEPTLRQPAVVLAVPVEGAFGTSGVLAASLDPAVLSRKIERWNRWQAGSADLTGSEGTVIAQSRPDAKRLGKSMTGHPLYNTDNAGSLEMVLFRNEEDRSSLGFAGTVGDGWKLLTQAEERDLFEPLKKAQLFAYGYLLVIMVLVALVALLAGRAMTSPIKKLTRAADRISVGELDIRVDIRRTDEIGELAEAISRMQDSLRLSIERFRKRRTGK